jgi:N-methylhydantoinase B/oxoprolinase/acetone carboxylase alpha subunit
VGEARVDFDLGPKERLKLRTEITDGKVVFDFSGSDPGTNHHLTFQGTFGACAGALMAFLRKPIPLNSGTLSVVEVVAPKGSIVNANFPKPVSLGMTDGLDVIANLVIQCLSMIDKTHAVASSGSTHCAMEIRFSGGRRFYDRVHPGTGADAKKVGLDGHSLWWRALLSPSIEEIERRYPLIFESVALRANSGGSGLNDGGSGVAKTFRVLEESELAWNFTDSNDKPMGFAGGKSALGPEMLVIKAGKDKGPDGAPLAGEKIKLPARGEMKLQPGDRVSILAPGGGGFGAK